MSERTLRTVLIGLGALNLAQAGWMIVSPGSFYDALAGFGAENSHFIRDVATFQIAAGAGLLVAAARAAWRVPALAITAAWYLAHAVNHLADISEADPDWVGPVDFAALLAGGLTIAGLAWMVATGRAGEPAGGSGPADGRSGSS